MADHGKHKRTKKGDVFHVGIPALAKQYREYQIQQQINGRDDGKYMSFESFKNVKRMEKKNRPKGK